MSETTDTLANGGSPPEGGGEAVRRKRRRKRRNDAGPQPLSINSLMDIVTILLVYLIKSYATSPIEVKDPSIELPTSTSRETVEEATVVMITGPERKAPNPANPAQSIIVPNTPAIVVDGKPLTDRNGNPVFLDTSTYRIPDAYKDPKTGNYVIIPLRERLREAREIQEATAEVSDKGGFTGKVVILADKRTPYRVLTDVLVTCGEAGFGEFKFAIVKDEG